MARTSIPPAEKTQIRFHPGSKRWNADMYLLLRASWPGPTSAQGAQFGYFLQGLKYDPASKAVTRSGSQDRNAEPIDTIPELLQVVEFCAIELRDSGEESLRKELGL